MPASWSAASRGIEWSLCCVVRRGGHIDMRAQAEVPSALRPDTPAQFRVKAESAEVERTGERKSATPRSADIREGVG